MFVILHPEIRLKEYGKETVEVIDNGSGILPANYEVLGIVLLSVCSVVYNVYICVTTNEGGNYTIVIYVAEDNCIFY